MDKEGEPILAQAGEGRPPEWLREDVPVVHGQLFFLCKHSESARPSPEAMGVDVFSTVKPLGFPIEILSDYEQTMNRYAILLIE